MKVPVQPQGTVPTPQAQQGPSPEALLMALAQMQQEGRFQMAGEVLNFPSAGAARGLAEFSQQNKSPSQIAKERTGRILDNVTERRKVLPISGEDK